MGTDITNSITELKELRQSLQANEQPEWVDTLDRNRSGNIKRTSSLNVTKIFANDETLKDLVRLNGFTKRMELYKNLNQLSLQPGELNNMKVQVKNYIESKYHVCFDDKCLSQGIQSYITTKNFNDEYNPIKQHITSVEWDGKHRMETYFIDYLGASDNKLVRQATRKWIIGAVTRAFKPGCKFELMPVLIGGQGVGKSTMAAALCPLSEDGDNREYFTDGIRSMTGDNDDDNQRLHRNWIVEVGEMSSFKKSDIDSTKAFISRQSDDYRLPYDKYVEEHYRTNVFIGTTNSPEFLKDRTGNRRFIPIEVGKKEPTKDFKNIDEDDIKQIVAEAYHYFKQGEKPILSDDILETLTLVQEEYMTQDTEEDAIKSYVNMLVPKEWEEYSFSNKQGYYERYINHNEYIDLKNHVIKDTSKLIPMPSFKTLEVAKIALGMKSSRGNTGTKISSVIQSMDEFKPTRTNKFRGYVRK